MTGGKRCFDNYVNPQNRTSSYRIERLKSKVIYSNAKANAASGGGPIVKANGSVYNGPVYVNSSKCLAYVDSYANFLSATKGKYYCTPDLSNTEFIDYDIYQGSTIVFDMSGVNVTDTSYNAGNYNEALYPIPSIRDASGFYNNEWPGIVTDPCGQLFGGICQTIGDFTNPTVGSVDICGNVVLSDGSTVVSQYAKQNRQTLDLPNFVFPGPLKFV